MERSKVSQRSSEKSKWRLISLDTLDLVTWFVIIGEIVFCPFTKVEESFNIQAMHDILFHPADLQKYDHFEFPGVVPRTFIGALTVSGIAFPFNQLLIANGFSKVASLVLVRAVLGTLLWFAYSVFKKQISNKFGKEVAVFFSLMSLTQFHIFFYMSRTLPNVFALFLVLLGYSCWFRESYTTMIALFSAAIVIFRCEVSILLGPIILQLLYQRKIPFWKTVFTGAICGLLSLAMTVAVDSYFWGRWIWPEGVVFWFNTYENKSSQWGVSPYRWYFVPAIPRVMKAAVFLIPYGLYYESRAREIFYPILAFLSLYSFLPHKELRFIFYVFPPLYLVAAIAMSRLYTRRNKHVFYKLLLVGAAGSMLASAVASGMIYYYSSLNYPSGHALQKLHHYEIKPAEPPFVHIDTYAAMNGISRFG
eukprot:TRINITY_DN7755_c0_g2_i1.p1 TRINITY_DN7755_c0_g2~~TRINITY_DN7755_c0_g2_i1.p1  ORF type:complete len:420 (+),score=46.76 TRINITY_DN7755_c0_g2_i1:35-1294(+)